MLRELDIFELELVSGGCDSSGDDCQSIDSLFVHNPRPFTNDLYRNRLDVYELGPDGQLQLTNEAQQAVDTHQFDWLGIATDLALIAFGSVLWPFGADAGVTGATGGAVTTGGIATSAAAAGAVGAATANEIAKND